MSLDLGSSNAALTTIHDRILGCFVGSALGDAIGLYTEFLTSEQAAQCYPSGTFTLLPEATPFRRDRHRSPFVPGSWTDDTDHAALVFLSFLHHSSTSDGTQAAGQPRAGPDPADFAARLSIWVQMGLRALDSFPLGLGRTVGGIVRTKRFATDPEGAARQHYGENGRSIAPNGSLMRTHPLGPVSLWNSRDDAFDMAARLSVVTHVDPRCIVSCVIGTGLIRGLVRGDVCDEEHVDAMIVASVDWYQKWRKAREAEDEDLQNDPVLDVDELKRHVEATDFADLKLDEPGKIGYVYKTLGSGVLLLRLALREVKASDLPIKTQLKLFEKLITDLTMQAGDADTNACFAGALLGAYLGFRALPANWRDGLRHGDWLQSKAEAVCKVLGVTEGEYDGAKDPDTLRDGGKGLLTQPQMEERSMLMMARIAKEDQEHNQKEKDANKKKSIFGSLSLGGKSRGK